MRLILETVIQRTSINQNKFLKEISNTQILFFNVDRRNISSPTSWDTKLSEFQNTVLEKFGKNGLAMIREGIKGFELSNNGVVESEISPFKQIVLARELFCFDNREGFVFLKYKLE